MGGVEKLLDACPTDQRHWEWDYLKRQCHTDLLTLQGHPGVIYSVAFSPDGTRIASASFDGTVKLWDATTGQETLTLTNTDKCWSVAFSPDGTRLASSSGTQIVVWDTATGREVFTLTGHPGVYSVAFSPDGKRLASASQDGTVKLWDARPWTPEAPIEREALGLLDYLFARPLCRADVLAHLNSSPTLRAETREKARALVGRYREDTDPERYHQASWAVVRQPYLNPFMYRLALRQAETACRLAPQRGPNLTTLGVAQYRAGQYAEARTTLVQADLLHQAASASLVALARQLPQALVTLPEAQPLHQAVSANLAFLTMVQHRLGQKEQAQATLSQLRETMKRPAWTKNEEAQGFLHEAEAVIEGQRQEAKP